MRIVPVSSSFLEGAVEDDLLDGGSLLVIEEAHVVGVLAHLLEDGSRMGETVSNCDAFESSDSAVVVLGFSENLLSNGRSVLACIALPENDQLMTGLELELIQTSGTIFKEFLQRNIEVVGDTGHIGTIDILKSLIGIPQASANRLINKDHVVVFSPAVVISDDIVRLHVGSD